MVFCKKQKRTGLVGLCIWHHRSVKMYAVGEGGEREGDGGHWLRSSFVLFVAILVSRYFSSEHVSFSCNVPYTALTHKYTSYVRASFSLINYQTTVNKRKVKVKTHQTTLTKLSQAQVKFSRVVYSAIIALRL